MARPFSMSKLWHHACVTGEFSFSLSRGDLEVPAYLPGDAAVTFADYWMEHFPEPEEARGGGLDRVPEERERGALRRDPASQERLWRRLGAAFVV